ncbi:hypothetical protein BH11PLA1_BH11PLA1_11350 [soil metagenome]
MRVAIIGASNDRSKFGNRALRAYRRAGHDAIPVNPALTVVEGVPCVPDVAAIDGPIDRVLFYVPPAVGKALLPALAERAALTPIGELWLNPGADGPEVIAEAHRLNLHAVRACAIVDIGASPYA